ncbi:hypothetical protein BY996DRAFT_4575731 [Phakopsora pachyrhizi]|nr:hypothetical protein BY996DRAFT_4575731 [Phakopsora pachyrhizi]
MARPSKKPCNLDGNFSQDTRDSKSSAKGVEVNYTYTSSFSLPSTGSPREQGRETSGLLLATEPGEITPPGLNFNNEQSDTSHSLFAEIRKNKFALKCALFASLGGILFGYDQGVVSITLVMRQFTTRFDRIDDNYVGAGSPSFWRGFLTAMVEFGAILGVLQAGFTAEKYGRHFAIRSGAIIFIIGSALQTASVEFIMLTIGRFIAGIGVGILSMTAPMYMGEISPPSIRGALLCLEEFHIVLGIVVAFYITYATRFISSEVSWRLPFGIQILPAMVILMGLIRLPPSPPWLASKGRNQECLESLALIRQVPLEDESVLKEWINIRVEAEFQRQATAELLGDPQQGSCAEIKIEFKKWISAFRSGSFRRTLVGVGLMFFQQFVGINALIYYSPSLFQTLGLEYETRLTMSGIMNICQLIGVSISFLIIDNFGRKPLLLFGSVLMAICHGSVAILLIKYGTSLEHHPAAGWAGVGFILLFMVVFGVSWGPIPWAIPSEIFPSSIRAKGVALSALSNWTNNFIIGLITPPVYPGGTFIFFTVASSLSFIFVWFVVPETAHVSLEEMDRVFGDGLGTDDKKKKDKILKKIISEP